MIRQESLEDVDFPSYVDSLSMHICKVKEYFFECHEL